MTHAEFVNRWFQEVWNDKSEAAIDDMLAVDAIGYGLSDPAGGDKIVGLEAFKRLHRAFVSAYPDIKVTVEDTVVEGDRVAARCTVTGTHAGDGIGVTPTNSAVEFSGMVIARVKNGKIVESWNEFNFMQMYSQLGVLSLNLQ